MGAAVVETGSRFSDRILQLLERVEHRVARTPSEKEAIYRLRYEAYIRNALVEPRDDGRLYDDRYDEDPNSWITSTYIDGELVATVRVNLGVGSKAVLPSLRVFSDVMSPHLRAGRTIADFTRAAARLEASRRFPELPYIALRPGYMAAEHCDADFAVVTPRAEHLAFYRRVFQFSAWSEARSYPNVAPKVICLGVDFHALRDRVEARYPFFRSTAVEREALFGPRGAAEAPSGATRAHRRFEARSRAGVR
jgi:hypothetical protein